MQPPPSLATLPLTHEQPIHCDQCADPAQMTASLGVALSVPVVRLTCLDHGVVCQFPVAATAFVYHRREENNEPRNIPVPR